MVGRKKASAKKPALPIPEHDEALHERLSRLEDVVSSLLEALTEKPDGEERKIKPTPALTKQVMARKAYRARQAKWAKRMSLTREQFIERYGDTDKAPPEMPKVRYQKKTKTPSSTSP